MTVLERMRTMTGRPWPARSHCGWYYVQPKVQAKELMDTPAAEIEALGDLIEREPHDRPQAEHLKLALAVDVSAGA